MNAAKQTSFFSSRLHPLMYRQNVSTMPQDPSAPPAFLLDDESLAKLSSFDVEWLTQLNQYILKHLGHPDLSVQVIAKHLHLSARQLQRKMNELTTYSPNAYVREMRLKRAYKLLQAARYATVKEVSYAVGFRDVRYFSKQFRKRFGDNPSTFLG